MKVFSTHKYIISFCLIALVAFSCKIQQSTKSTRRLNLNFLYNPNYQTLNAKIVIHNSDDTTSTVHCLIPTNSLFFFPTDTNEIATILVHYKLFKTSSGLKLLDTSSFIRTIVKKNYINEEYFNFSVPTSDTGSYMLDIFISDKNKFITYHQYLNIEKRKHYSDNDFLLVDKKSMPYFDKWLTEQDTFIVKLRKNMPTEWKISWFTNSFKNSSPPYSMSSNKDFIIPNPDSSKVIAICDTCYLSINRKGIFHIYRDSIGNGKTIFVFSKEYPKMVRPSELLQPIRMLTSQKEFNELNIIADKKESVDKFWINAGGNVERAREIIRIFYTRAILANQYFTSYTEGWKTDRGMIYIIFGLPTAIYKASNIEQWIYGTPESNKTLVFTFIKKYHAFSNNHFVLERNENYKISWLQAVDTWRNGRVFSIAN